MGYVPPRAQRADESDDDYFEYLLDQLARTRRLTTYVFVGIAVAAGILLVAHVLGVI